MAETADEIRPRRLLAVFVPLFAVAVGWGLARYAGYQGLAVLGWLPGAIGIAVGAWYLLIASRTRDLNPAGRLFWRHMALAGFLIAPATKPLTEASLGGRKTGPVLTGAVVLLSVSLLLVLWALLRLPTRSRSRGDWLRLGLDAATVLVCSATFLWHFVLQPLQEVAAPLPKVFGLLMLSMLCMLAVLAVVKLILVGTEAVDMRALQALGAVVLVGAVGSALVPVLQDPRLAGVSDITTTAEALLIGVAGVIQRRRVTRVAVVAGPRRPYSVLPYTAVAAVFVLLIVVTVRAESSLLVLLGAVAATAAVVVRQLLAFRDNDALLGSVREHQRLLHEQATHDALTGLPNRALFNDTLESASAAILIDLDDFKAVNDTLGHPVGDGLLVEVGRRLRAVVRPGDLVARLGGDEFAILITDAADMGDVTEKSEMSGMAAAALLASPASVVGPAPAVAKTAAVAKASAAANASAVAKAPVAPTVAKAAAVAKAPVAPTVAKAAAVAKAPVAPTVAKAAVASAVVNASAVARAPAASAVVNAAAVAKATVVAPASPVATGPEAAPAPVVPPATSAEALAAMAQRILTELAAPIRTHGHILTITASVGVAQRRDEDDAQALLRHADIAMYAAKKRGKGTYAQYTSDLSGLLLAPESRLGDLRRAVAELRPPFALEVGRAALVCPGFAADLVALLDAAGIAPAGLTLVIPAAQISDEDAVRGVLRELRAAGLGLALDHTGNRQVRLDLLAALPFTRLILDPSFFKGGDRRQEALTDAVIRFAQDAGIEYEAATLQESAL